MTELQLIVLIHGAEGSAWIVVEAAGKGILLLEDIVKKFDHLHLKYDGKCRCKYIWFYITIYTTW